MSKLILASGSPRRKELLSLDQISFEICIPEIDETPLPRETPKAMVKRLSLGKSKEVFKLMTGRISDGFIVSADTTVVNAKGKNLGKPVDRKEAIQMIASLQGKAHFVFTAYTVLKIKAGKIHQTKSRVVTTKVYIRKLNKFEIEQYIDRGESFDKAGAYAAQGIGMNLVQKISGSYTNVVGLPMAELLQDLRTMGWRA